MPALPPPFLALAVLVGLELTLFVLSRGLRRLRVTWLLHAWAVVLALAAGLARAAAAERWPGAWAAVATAALLLTGLALFALVDAALLQAPHGRPPRTTPKLLRDCLRILVLVALALTCATRILGFEISTVLVSSTVLSAIVGFALQDVLKNVVAGVALQLEQSLSIGHWILLDGTPAQVIEMSWRSVKLRTNDDVVLFEPNTSLVASRITSYGSGSPPVALQFHLGLPYGAAPERVKEIVLQAAREAPGVASEPAPQAFVDGFGESAVTYLVRAWTNNPARLNAFRDAVLARSWYALQRADVAVPFPTRTVHLHQAADDDTRRRHAELATMRALLARVEILGQLGDRSLENLASAARRCPYAPDEVLVREGDAGDSLFIVEHGTVRVTKHGAVAGTPPLELARLGPGSFFGEMSLLTGTPRSATVVAETAVEVIVLSHAAVAEALERDPSLAERLSAAVSARSIHAEEALEDRRRGVPADEAEATATVLARLRAFFGLDRS